MAGNRRGLVTYLQVATTETPLSEADRARARFKKAMKAIVDERRVDTSLTDLSELEMFEAATALTKQK